MRLAVAALIALALAVPAAADTGGWATASASRGGLTLKLHYEMTCGQPGPGPAVIRLPSAITATPPVTALVNGAPRAVETAPHTVTVQLPRPPQVTCMSIGPGVLVVTLHGLRLPTAAGTYAIHASVRSRAFTARLRIR